MGKYFKLISRIIVIMAIGSFSFFYTMHASAWGDSDGGRPDYSLQEINEGILGDKITFNSIDIADSDYEWYRQTYGEDIPTGTITHEKNYVGAREDTGINAGPNNVWNGNDITVTDGAVYLVRLYVHNNSLNGWDSVAEDTKVWFNIPLESAERIRVNGYIASSNASPSEYVDYVDFNSDVPFHLEYIYGSALLENNGIGANGGIQLSDNIIQAKSASEGKENGGVLIGYNALDGRVPGCYQYSNYICIKVRAVFDYEFSVEQKVRVVGGEDKEFKYAVNANIGDTVEFQLEYRNLSTESQSNVSMRDILPPGLEYIEGSTMLYNKLYPNGLNVNHDDIVGDGIIIGRYAGKTETNVGANAFIRFCAKVVDASLENGVNELINWGQTGVGETVLQDYASVFVVKNTESQCLYRAGVALIVLGIIAILILLVLIFIKRKQIRK